MFGIDIKTCLTAALCASVCATQAVSASISMHGTVFEKAGNEYKVDPVLLYSIALVESAVVVPGKQGYINPYAWTLRTKQPFYGETRKKAEDELRRLLKTQTSVDVGMMQINTRWHGHRVKDVTELLDPLTNVRIAAQILSEQIDRYPHDAAKAIGAYHSSDPKRADWYARHVLRVYTGIKNNIERSPK